MINKTFLTIIIVGLWLFASFWCFNHINAWIGIGVFILGIYISAKQIFKTNKKSEQ
jgi:RsiW-degrading membrane proteinase PrsW (M82 family)